MIIFVGWKKKPNLFLYFSLLLEKSHKAENDLTHKSEQRVINAEERALVAEKEMSKMQEQLKVCLVMILFN
jgi:hypothetical protein